MKARTVIRILIIASLYAVLYFIYSLYSIRGSLRNLKAEWPSFLYLFGLSVLASFTIYFVFRKIRTFLRESNSRSLPFILTASASLILAMIFSAGGGLAYRLLFFPELLTAELNQLHPGIRLQVVILAVFTGLVLAVVDNNLYSYRYLQELKLTTKKLQTEQVNLRFNSLKSQISPHFLFNSLNTISSLLYRDLESAEKFIRNLASVYLNVLNSFEKTLVPLESELKLVDHYAYLMQVRFEEAFRLELDLPENLERMMVPPLSVQMLLENAIKHNRMNLENPLTVKMKIDKDYLVVSNNFIGDPGHVKIGQDLYQKPRNSPGIGLENIKSRYRILGAAKVQISKNENFTVSIPIITTNEAAVVH